jgi:type IV secretion system protein TrbL
MKKIVQLGCFAVALTLLSFPIVAPAASEGPQPSEILSVIADVMKKVVNAVIGQDFADRVKASALALSAKVSPVGEALAGIFTLLSLLWGVMIAMLEKKSVVVEAFEALLFGVIAAALIKSFPTLAGTIYDIGNSVMNSVGLNVGETFVRFITSILTPVGNIFKNLADKSGWTFEFAKALVDGVFSVLILAIAAWFLIQAASSIMGVFIMGPIFLGVGIVFGPVMCATIASAYTRQWFSQWLNFLVGSTFLTVTAVVVMSLLTGLFQNAFQVLGTGQSSAVALGIAMIAAGLSKLFESVPGITDAIFPGRTGAGNAINSKSIGAAANPVNHLKTGARSGMYAAKSVSAGVAKISNALSR